MRNAYPSTHLWLFFTTLAFVFLPAELSAQQWITVTPEEAASHLLKKVEPVYPPFAKAAGIQGTVQIHIGISLIGRLGALEEETGPPSLRKAAEDAVLQYVWKPFEKGGHHVAADTSVSIVFRLPGNVPSPPPPPPVSSARFTWFERCVRCVGDVSPQLRVWLADDLKREVHELGDGSESDPEFLMVEAALRDEKAPVPKQIELIDVPTAQLGAHSYLFRPDIQLAFCGATGNCSIELLEVDANGIRSVGPADMDGGGYYFFPRPGSPFPDIFIYSHESASEGSVAGYENVKGLWGQVYCGKITFGENGQTETDDIHVCH